MTRKQIYWVALGGLAVLLRTILSARPDVIEQYYSRGLFLAVRWAIDHLLGWLPIPLLYLFLLGVFSWLVVHIRNGWRAAMPWKVKLVKGLGRFVAFVGGLVFFFLLLWGFNYGRLPLEHQLGLEPQPLKLEQLKEELKYETTLIIQLRQDIIGATDSAITFDFLPVNLEQDIRRALENRLAQYSFPTVGEVRGRMLYPRGIFLRFSSAGLYFPWVGEGNIDAGLHPLQIPYVMAHEMAHGYGFGDEGTCDFWAYLACAQSDDPIIAYIGHLNHWRSLAADYRRYEPEQFKTFRQQLPIGIQSDLEAINKTLLAYPDIMPRLRYVAYDTYLKAQGISEGMLNYDRATMLVYSWRKTKQI